MYWYVIHTKPRQEQRALLNLEQQGFECYLPVLAAERLRQGVMTLIDEPLFPRYLFIRLDTGESGKSWGPIRSTKGVSRLVTFGAEPAKVNERLIELLRARSNTTAEMPLPLFTRGERLLVTEGPFAGIEAVYHMSDGGSRAMVLVELLSKLARINVRLISLRKVG